MNRYTIMLVDDEEEVRKSILNRIDWDALGYEVIGDADNGQEALDMAQRLNPDVIMTDIKMPFMDGLELGRRINEMNSSTKLIIFTGFDDFEFAKQAIQINVAEYVLKPINSAELTEVLLKLKQTLDKEFEEKRSIEKLKKHYEESLPILKDRFFTGLIEGRIDSSDLKQRLLSYNPEMTKDYYCVVLFRADSVGIEDTADELIPFSVKNSVIDILSKNYAFVSFVYSGGVAAIINLLSDKSVNSLISTLNEICTVYKRIMSVPVTAGMGAPVNNLFELKTSTDGAEQALEYRAIFGTGKTIYIKDVEPDNSLKLQLSDSDEKLLCNAVKLSEPEKIEKIIERLFSKTESGLLPINKYQLYVMEIVTALLRLIREYGLNADDIFDGDFNYYSFIQTLTSVEQIKEWLNEKCRKISTIIQRERVDSSKLLVGRAKEYINENYSNPDLSVETLCSVLHLSPAYFSTLFKRETQTTFITYLTEVRLNEAMRLLNTTVDKTYTIAAKVGYDEPNYFSYVFKKKYGVSPTKYRSSSNKQ